MAASDYDFALTRAQICNAALRKVGILGLGQPAANEEMDTAVEALNVMVKSWQNRGVHLWTQTTQTFNTVAGTGFQAVSTDPPVIDVQSAYIRDGTTDFPLERISYQKYQELAHKTQEGRPIYYAVEPEIVPVIYLWPVPNDVWAVYYRGIAKAKDFDTAAGTPDFPSRWLAALIFGLTAELCAEYKMPISDREYWGGKFETEFALAKRSDRDPSDVDVVENSYPCK
jgi:hypothetical protein